MTITKSTSTHNTAAAAGRSIDYIVIHYTAGISSKAGSAANTAAYYKSTDREVSSDYVVDDGGAVLYNPDIKNRYTWHCGGSKYSTKGGAYYGKCKNANSIGIEVCSTNSAGSVKNANDKTWSFTSAAVENAVQLTKQLMKEYGIDASHVIRHYDVTGKLCPGIVGWNADSGSEAAWQDFKKRISSASSTKTDKLYRVRKSWSDAKSQIGAYASLDNAKKACKAGYTVYDWNGKAVYTKASGTVSYAKGAKITLSGATLYASSTASSGTKKSGTYYIYDGQVVNGRMRITNSAANVGKTPIGSYVTGWVKKTEIR